MLAPARNADGQRPLNIFVTPVTTHPEPTMSRSPLFFSILFAAMHAAPALAVELDEPGVTEGGMGYVRMGGGFAGGVAGEAGGTAYGSGWRYQARHLALDIGVSTFIPTKFVENAGAATFNAHVGGLYMLAPDATRSPFVGGALGVGWTGGFGLESQLSGGYEIFRDRPYRVFGQADLSLPLHGAKSIDSTSGSVDSGYQVALAVTVGAAFDFGRR